MYIHMYDTKLITYIWLLSNRKHKINHIMHNYVKWKQ